MVERDCNTDVFLVDVNEIGRRAFSEANLLCLPPIPPITGQISGSPMQTQPTTDGPRVCLLKLSRRPAVLRECLLGAAELNECRNRLEQEGLAVELSSGAKVFVKPAYYEATMEAIRLGGFRLCPNHVIVDEDLEPVVKQVVSQIPRQEHVNIIESHVVPLAFAEAAAASDHDIVVSRTFVNVRLPSSLYSELSLAAYTV